MYQNCYLHGSPSRFSAKSATYTTAGCQHIIAICTADANSVIYTAAVCPHKIAIYTAAIQEPNRLYTLLPGVYKKSLFTRQPFKSQIGHIHCCRMYTKNRYLHGSRSRAKSAIYIAAGFVNKIHFLFHFLPSWSGMKLCVTQCILCLH